MIIDFKSIERDLQSTGPGELISLEPAVVRELFARARQVAGYETTLRHSGDGELICPACAEVW